VSQVALAYEKHGLRVLTAGGGKPTLPVMMKLIQERLDQGWYEDEDAEKARKLLETIPRNESAQKLAERAWAFLRSRNRAEYERIEIVEVEA